MADDDPQRTAAIRRLKTKRTFQQHLVTYLVVNAFLVVVWALSGGGFFWPGFVLAGWGVGIAMHGWTTYGSKGITEDEIRREMDRGGDSVS